MLISKLLKTFHRYRKAEIIKVFSFTALSTSVKMLTGFITVKVVAVVVGPTGIALLGQLNNFSNIVMTIASGGINNGITKHVAENKDAPRKIQLFLSTALQITLTLSLISGLCLILSAKLISHYILSSDEYSYVITLFGITLTLYTLNNFLMSILNGYKEFHKFVNISIVTSIFGAFFTIGLVWAWKLPGALVSAVTYQSIVFFITLFMVAKSKWFVLENFNTYFSKAVLKKYLGYSLMAVVTAATVPVSQLLIRSYVITHLSATEAGWWEAMNRISGMYLLVITSSFGVYYLPRLSEIKEKEELKKEILTAFKIILPVITIGFSFLYIFRDFIIQILFSKQFYPMRDLFIYQLIGDVFKISIWLLGYALIAKSFVKYYITMEVFFSITYILFAFSLLQSHGLVGILYAYILNSSLCLAFIMFIFKNKVINE